MKKLILPRMKASAASSAPASDPPMLLDRCLVVLVLEDDVLPRLQSLVSNDLSLWVVLEFSKELVTRHGPSSRVVGGSIEVGAHGLAKYPGRTNKHLHVAAEHLRFRMLFEKGSALRDG